MRKNIPYCENFAIGLGAPKCSEECCNYGACHKDAYFEHIKKSNLEIIVKHGYWTGRTFMDDAHAEGFGPNMTEEEKERIRENDKHVTHCSECGAMFDDRYVSGWKVCPRCITIMDLEAPENSYFLAWKSVQEGMERVENELGITSTYTKSKDIPQCPNCHTNKFVKSDENGLGSISNGIIVNRDHYHCDKCGGNFSIVYTKEIQ